MTDVTINKETPNKKGGRPTKAIKKDQLLGVKCSLLERNAIEFKAKESNVSVSEFLRKLCMSGKIDMKIITVSKEIFQFKGLLNHLAANLNQVAKKRNRMDELNALERADLQLLSGQVKQMAEDIKNYLQ